MSRRLTNVSEPGPARHDFGNKNPTHWSNNKTVSCSFKDLMTPIIASITNLVGPDMMVILLIVLLLFGAKKLPELARGMGRAVKEFSAARDQIEKEVTQPDSGRAMQSKLLDTNDKMPAQ
jgi:sec-independent protein translocase protein TatA